MSDFTPLISSRDDDEARHTAMYQKRNVVARKLDLQLNVIEAAEGNIPQVAAMSPVSRLAENLEGGFSIHSPHVSGGSGIRQSLRRQVSFPGMEHPAMSPPHIASQLPPQCPSFPTHGSPLGEKHGSPMDLVNQNKENNFHIGRRRPSISRPAPPTNFCKNPQRSHSMDTAVFPPLDFVESPIVVKAKKTKRCVSMDTSGSVNDDMQVASSFNETRSSGSSLASSWEPASPPKFNGTGEMESPKCLLPTLAKGSQPDLKSLSPDTVADLLEGKYKNVIDDYVIVDCRYPYEFEGGRIRNAVNLCNPIESSSFFFKELARVATTKNLAIVIHCEFSTKRGPRMWRHIRNLDRKFNHDNYPNLYFKDMYLLEGGYKCFFEKFPQLCEPSEYICMHDPNFSNELKSSTQSVRRSWAKTKEQTDELLRFSV